MKFKSSRKTPSPISTLFILSGMIGPGLILTSINIDAGGIATYSLAGAKSGLRLLWTLIPITIALIIVQEMAARIGIVNRKGLANLIKEKFGLVVTFYSLFFLLIVNLANTMAQFAGIASSLEIFGISKFIAVPLCSLFVWLIVVNGKSKIVLKTLLVGCFIYLSYIISGVIAGANWGDVIQATFIPNISILNEKDMPILVGLIGTSVTPWVQFYIQSTLVEKEISLKNLWRSKINIVIASTVTFLLTLFITICCAVSLYDSGMELKDLKNAAEALRPLAGDFSSFIFAIGLFNASLFTTTLLPLATSHYICEGMGWEIGVNKKLKAAPQFFTIFTALISSGAAIVLMPGIDLFNILIYSQILNGVLIPIIIIFIIKICNDPEIVGKYTNTAFYNLVSYSIVGIMIGTNLVMIYCEVIAPLTS